MTDESGQSAFGFLCAGCGAWHTGVPAYHFDGPSNLYAIPQAERADRCIVETDGCVIDSKEFYLRALIEIPVHGTEDALIWGVWVSVSQASFGQWVESFEQPQRAHIGPFFGWLDTALPLYPETRSLRTRVHLRDDFRRPFVELEPTDHSLAVEQRKGIGTDRVAEIVVFAEGRLPQET